MLADTHGFKGPCGLLSKEIYQPQAFRHSLINFISNELPRWRDRDDLRKDVSETGFTSQLCGHLNSAARWSDGWDILQFRVEESDENYRGRKIDLVPSPCGATLWIEGRGYTDLDALMPIECKRLPTPLDKDRDEREYVFSKFSSTGGIQRFKEGYHGASHDIGAMIGYLQAGTVDVWSKEVEKWIRNLANAEAGWSSEDLLNIVKYDVASQIGIFRSFHKRKKDLPIIELNHIWVEMN